nr:MAG TPA: hypothetical protein [Caudoviricetes sp.]DAR39529.1 MAG TPA: hypothetical protein [Caudoviricetes sp.]
MLDFLLTVRLLKNSISSLPVVIKKQPKLVSSEELFMFTRIPLCTPYLPQSNLPVVIIIVGLKVSPATLIQSYLFFLDIIMSLFNFGALPVPAAHLFLFLFIYFMHSTISSILSGDRLSSFLISVIMLSRAV